MITDLNRPKHNKELRDFTVTIRTVPISLLAVLIGFAGTGLAWCLLKLIWLATNVFYFGRWSTAAVSPATNHLGLWSVLIPIVGASIVGLMARYGSEKIRGHGMPEAIEAVLMNGSRVQPKLAILKPVSAAISIGSGGPFGAEGPIIMTGGAVGSLVAQFFKLTDAERKTLLVSGSAAGMAAVFATPLAATLLAVELLLFEWKPRSFVPVALAASTAAFARRFVLGTGPLFPVVAHDANISALVFACAALMGISAGVFAVVVTQAVYKSEDVFHRLPLHWMWWPPIGGLVIGLGGLISPQALGVGYDMIGQFLQGSVPLHIVVGLLIVKAVIWSFSLGSGTSGGVLAPLLLMGATLGALESHVFPGVGIGYWPLIGMAAMLSGTMGSPMTAVVFAIELTGDLHMLLPTMLACVLSYAFTSLVSNRSILTEKIARRGYHLSREYSVDPMEVLFVREVMRPAEAEDYVSTVPADAYALLDEQLTSVEYKMAKTSRTRLPVVKKRGGPVVGAISLEDLFKARTRHMDGERNRQRVINIRRRFGIAARRTRASVS